MQFFRIILVRGACVLAVSVCLTARTEAREQIDRSMDWTNLPAPAVDVPPPEDSADASRMLEEHFRMLEQVRDEGRFDWIMTRLETLSTEYPGNGRVLWRLARTRTDVAERTDDRRERRRLLRLAIEEAEQAVQALPSNSNAHLTMAVVAGRKAMISRTREKIDLSRTVREYADMAVDLDSLNDLAWHVRGRWHFEVTELGFLARNFVRLAYGGLPDASIGEAESDFRRAIELHDRVVHRYELGRVLLEQDRIPEAREQLRIAVEMPREDVTDPVYKERARELLQGL